jgi:hypothetical protein
MVGRQAVLAYQRDRAAGLPMEDALAKHGDKMALSEQGRQVIATEEKISGALEKRQKAQQEKAKAVQEQETRQYMLTEADRVEATNPQLAQWLRTAARDPAVAKHMTDFLQGQAKLQETKVSESGMKYAAARLRLQRAGIAEPTEGEISQEVLRFGQSGDVKVAPNGTPYRIVQDEAGNARAVPIPGVPPKPPDEDATIWGLAVGNATERAAKEGRPVTEQEVLQEAHQLRLETGKAKATTVSITAGEREKAAEKLSHLDSINTIMQMLDAGQAKNVGGVWGANTLLSKIKAVLKPNSVEAREFEYMVAISRNLASDYLKALTGAAVGDDPTYKAGVPDIEHQTLGQFRAALYAYDRNIRNLIEYGNKIRQTGEISLPPAKRWTPFPAAHVPRPVNTPAGAIAPPGETPPPRGAVPPAPPAAAKPPPPRNMTPGQRKFWGY